GKNQHAIAAVLLQEPLQQLQFPGGGQREALLFAVSLKGGPAFLGTATLAQKALPAVRAAHRDTVCLHEAPIDQTSLLVALLFFGRKLHITPIDLILGQE